MTKRTIHRTILVCASLIAMPAMAQGTTEAGQEGASLADIVVTAQRRSENLQNVPISVTAITSEQAIKLGITQPDVIAQMVPGLQLNHSAWGLTPFLRGVGTNSVAIGNEPAVALFVDDVYLPTGSAGVFQLNSISSIEVLKGPQGTLFGRNATGGVIHIRTRDPSFDPSASATASYGNYDTISGQLYGSTGLTDTVAINFALQGIDQRKGWGVNGTTGNEANSMSGWGGRAKLLWNMGEETSLLVAGSYDRRSSDQGQPGRSIAGTFTRDGYSADAAGLGFYDVMSNLDTVQKSTTRSLSGKLTHDFGSARLVLISAFSKTVVDPVVSDSDGSPSPFFQTREFAMGGRTFTQEVQLLSPEGSAVKWILGAFYLHDRSFMDATYEGQAFGTSKSHTDAVQRTNSIAGFGQVTTEILPRTNLTLGLRYTSDRRSLDAVARLLPATGAAVTFGPFEDAKTFNSVTGRASIDHHFSDDLMGYIAYNRGFKSGIYNFTGIVAGTTTLPPPVNPETLDAYTIGFKSEFLNRRLRVNAEAFLYEYSDLQVQIVLPTGTTLTNASKATIKGIDFEISAIPVRNLTVSASIGLLDGRYKDFRNAPSFFLLPPNAPTPYDPARCSGPNPYPAVQGSAPATQRSCDVSGNRLIQAPPFSSNLQLLYTLPTDLGDFDLSASWAHGGNYEYDVFSSPLTRQPRTDIVNGSVQWTAPGGTFNVRLWANNLTGEKYYTIATTGSTAGAKYAAAAPRTYGVTLGANF
ncbi:TonB-dependent receptor [Sphingobium sp. SA916]|uniref:TonB-dependent receptor n=1 Tax=Sphingobium sp. SA916 TaxID=1851207 RepID=UPI000C9F3C2F|nr:TonB-dependent receptor [Sphingobium sp. SA916]